MEKEKKNQNIYECTICLENAKEPVVTKCGHIFCWPCIYSWMESKGANAKCPNCKNPISKDNLIPIYTKEENENNTKKFNIPKRPQGERTQSTEDTSNNGGFSSFSFGSFGFFPMFGVGYNFGNNFFGNNFFGNQNINNANTNNTPSFLDSWPENSKKALLNLIILLLMILFYFNLQ